MLFGISTFSSKVLSFVLTRLYTSVLLQESFGIVDLVTAFANLLIPLVSLGIANAVIRFGLENDVPKSGVYTNGLLAIFSGFGILLLFYPLIASIEILKGHVYLMYLYVLVSCLRTLSCQFVRAKMYIRLYAIDGILSTIYTVGFNVLFLVVLKMGTAGYLLAIIAADALSTIGLTLVAALWKYIDFKKLHGKLFKDMLRYSLPLVPASMFWWITNASDKFFIAQMRSTAENGLYAAAYKVPSVVSILSTIFTEAWQLSAITDGQGKGREKFFSQIFGGLMAVSFLMGSGLVYSSRLVMRFLVAPAYFIAWKFVPILVLATVYSTMVAFLNSVYMVEKRSGLSLITMMAGAVSNIVLNALLIKDWGANGAAFATFLSYVLVFVIRAVNTKKLIKIRFNVGKIVLNTLLLFAQALVMINELDNWQLIAGLLLLTIGLLNISSLVKSFVGMIKRRGSAAPQDNEP